MLSALGICSYLILRTTLQGWYYYPYCVGENTLLVETKSYVLVGGGAFVVCGLMVPSLLEVLWRTPQGVELHGFS